MTDDWLMAPCPPPSEAHAEAAEARQNALTKPKGALGVLERLAIQIAALQRTDRPRADNVRIVPLTLVVCLLVLFLSIRWLPGMVLPLVSVGVSTIITIGAMALFGEPMNVINNILPPLLVIIGVSEAIHVIGRYREQLEHSATKLEAAKRTVQHMALA